MTFKTIGQVARYKPLRECGMEELAMRQGTISPSGGVLFARNIDGEEKNAARQRVLDLFTLEKWDRPLNMLTLPGVAWRFERKLLAMRHPGWTRSRKPRATHFTGIENDRGIYYASATQMPGVETPDAMIWPVRPDRFPFAEHAIKTRFASFIFANVDDALRHDWKPAQYREQHMVGWDAAWLDYTGPISIERMNAIARFYRLYIRDTLVVTALRARWNKVTSAIILKSGGHSNWLQKHLPGEVLHDLEYFDTSPMTQFAVRKVGGQELTEDGTGGGGIEDPTVAEPPKGESE